jgi:hypothetical protein
MIVGGPSFGIVQLTRRRTAERKHKEEADGMFLRDFRGRLLRHGSPYPLGGFQFVLSSDVMYIEDGISGIQYIS